MKKVKISPLSIFWIFVLIFSKTPHLLPLSLAILTHEAGHLIFAKILKIKISRLHLTILGARMEMEGEISYLEELLVALGGPLFGFCTFGIFFPFASQNTSPALCSDIFLPFSILSLCLSIFNLVPISSLDGGRILKSLLCGLFSLSTAEKIMQIVTFFTLFSLWIFSVYLLIKLSGGLSMFVFCSILFAKSFILNAKNGDFASF